MTGKELIAALEQLDMDIPIYYIDNNFIGPLEVCDIKEEEIDKAEWFENKFVGYRKKKIIVLGYRKKKIIVLEGNI